MIEPTNRDELDCQWQANEGELNRLNAMSIAQLEVERDAIEFELGRESQRGSRKWVGMGDRTKFALWLFVIIFAQLIGLFILQKMRAEPVIKSPLIQGIPQGDPAD